MKLLSATLLLLLLTTSFLFAQNTPEGAESPTRVYGMLELSYEKTYALVQEAAEDNAIQVDFVCMDEKLFAVSAEDERLFDSFEKNLAEAHLRLYPKEMDASALKVLCSKED